MIYDRKYESVLRIKKYANLICKHLSSGGGINIAKDLECVPIMHLKGHTRSTSLYWLRDSQTLVAFTVDFREIFSCWKLMEHD